MLLLVLAWVCVVVVGFLVAVGAVHGWWSLWLGGNDLNIVYREDTFFAGAKVAAEPPVVAELFSMSTRA